MRGTQRGGEGWHEHPWQALEREGKVLLLSSKAAAMYFISPFSKSFRIPLTWYPGLLQGGWAGNMMWPSTQAGKRTQNPNKQIWDESNTGEGWGSRKNGVAHAPDDKLETTCCALLKLFGERSLELRDSGSDKYGLIWGCRDLIFGAFKLQQRASRKGPAWLSLLALCCSCFP